MNWITDYESVLRALVFFGLLSTLLAWELNRPTRVNVRKFVGTSQVKRFLNNLALSFIGLVILKLFPFISATYAASISSSHATGIISFLNINDALSIFCAIILLDLGIYWQHRLSHKIPLLWRLHKVHHSDPDFDVSTALRFHPFELVFSMLFKMILVIAIGAPVEAVIIFEILLNGGALFNHSNASLPKRAEKIVRAFIVTPDMHRTHHSPITFETNSNYGFFLSIWDRIFGSYRKESNEDPREMDIGLNRPDTNKLNSLLLTLKLPFLK